MLGRDLSLVQFYPYGLSFSEPLNLTEFGWLKFAIPDAGISQDSRPGGPFLSLSEPA